MRQYLQKHAGNASGAAFAVGTVPYLAARPLGLEAGADVYVTGEIAYHKALDAVDVGLCVVEAGHAATEYPAIAALSRGLQIAADAVQYNICVLESEAEMFF